MTAMYRPAANAVDEEAGWQLLADSRAGHLITAAAGDIDATFLPFVVDVQGRRVLAHFARGNPQWRIAHNTNAMLIATGADAYISPGYYATKQETGKVVPTWNYTLVHAHGVLRVHDDVDWLRDLVDRLTNLHEQNRDDPWAITDAPADYIDRNLKAIVGVELIVERLEATRKLSQNRTAEDFTGVVAGLSHGDPQERAVAREMQRIDAARDARPASDGLASTASI
jgi:transcriptional regulator